MTNRYILRQAHLSFAAIAICAVSFGGAAYAQSLDAVSKTISYADLDLSAKEGQDRLETRIKSAIRQVCGEANPRELSNIAAIQQCRVSAMNAARRDMKVAIANYSSGSSTSQQVAVLRR